MRFRVRAARAGSMAAAVLLLSACASVPRSADPAVLQQQVLQAERAFARSMAERDHAAFTTFLSEEAVFFSGETPIRGKQAVSEEWRPFFRGAQAPFSWEPDHVEVLASGRLALSSGPVYDPTGRPIGRFNSVWRQERGGQWHVVFDKGSPLCPRGPATAQQR